MAKKTVGKTRSVGTARPTAQRDGLHVDVKVGILHTIADAIYPTPPGKIREAVANAQDNGADQIIIYADRTAGTLSLFDNGSGITIERFKLIFKSIGLGLLSNDNGKLSYFGLGLMSVFKLGKQVKIFTRPSGQRDMLLVEVNSEAIFDKRNKDKSVSFLDTCISPVKHVTALDRASSTAPVLDDILNNKPFAGVPDSFTEILIEGISVSDLDMISSQEFETDLRKLLPLRSDKQDPFLSKFQTKRARDRVIKVFDSREFCPAIDVFFGLEGERAIHQLWKYFPLFRGDLSFPDDNVMTGVADSGQFSYYFVHTIAEDFYRSEDRHSEDDRETGFWVRNQNFLVKGAHFLEKPGSGARIIQQPLRNWVFGEVFHKDMNSFLTVARNDYLYQKPEFHDFREQVRALVKELNDELRRLAQETERIYQTLVVPFAQFTLPNGAIKNTEQRLRRLMPPDLSEVEFQKEALARLGELRSPGIEKEQTRIDLLMEKSRQPLVLGEDDNAIVRVDPGIRGKVQEYQLGWDPSRKRVVVTLSPDLFAARTTVFLGKSFEVFFVTQGAKDDAVSFDLDRSRIYVNPFNATLTEYSVSLLDIYVALQIADAMSPGKKELKANLMALLGPAKKDVAKYITPLGEDLRRTLRFAKAGA